jgi:hypothetical protein
MFGWLIFFLNNLIQQDWQVGVMMENVKLWNINRETGS